MRPRGQKGPSHTWHFAGAALTWAAKPKVSQSPNPFFNIDRAIRFDAGASRPFNVRCRFLESSIVLRQLTIWTGHGSAC